MDRGRLFLSGNEAIARGALRAGAGFACGYPGTPSTEIIEALALLGGLTAEWCVNEKVALETAIGASLAGVRSLVTMKHVGLNVAADPFMALAITGVNAGLVVVSADDPGMHSSQNEQDNRTYAKFAKVPLLEPSDSQEAYEFVAEAFALSEEFDTPVIVRSTTRLSHGRGCVHERARVEPAARGYERDIAKYVMMPQHARERNRRALERLSRLRSRAETSTLNVLEAGTTDFGIIASGVAYAYAREAFPKAWFLKLGMSNPLPYRKVAKLFESVSRVAVVEELDPYIEEQVRALGLPVVGKEVIPADGELDQEAVRAALEPVLRAPAPRRRRPVFPPEPKITPPPPKPLLPERPPVLCAGCPHRAVYAMLRQRKVAALGDIGCYTLGALPPLLSLDSCLCMGASIGMMSGMNKALGRKAAVAVIGDSTFFHSGVTPLIDAHYNEALGSRDRARQPHHGHDRPPGAPGQRAARRRKPGAGARHRATLPGSRRALLHGRRIRRGRARAGAQGGARRTRSRRPRRPRAVRPHDVAAAGGGPGRRRALQPLRPVRRSRLSGARRRRLERRDQRRLQRLRRVSRRLQARRPVAARPRRGR